MNNMEIIPTSADDVLEWLKAAPFPAAPADMVGTTMLYLSLRQIEKVAGEALKVVRESVEGFLEEGEIPELGGRRIIWETNKRQTFDWKALRSEWPVFWETYGAGFLIEKEVRMLVVRKSSEDVDPAEVARIVAASQPTEAK